jgi:hypothetical protein
VADPDTYNRITLKFSASYARRGGAEQVYQMKFSLSGDALTSSADAEEVATALADPILGISQPDTSWIGWLYYAPGSEVNSYQGSYATGAKPGTQAGYLDNNGAYQQLEVCALLKAVTGVSSKGKAVYLMKHVHNVQQSNTGAGVLNPIDISNFADWSTGLGTHDLVTVSPTTGEASQAWEVDPALYTRQLRRGYLPKA